MIAGDRITFDCVDLTVESCFDRCPFRDTVGKCKFVIALNCKCSRIGSCESVLTKREDLSMFAVANCRPTEADGSQAGSIGVEFEVTCQGNVFALSVVSDSACVVIHKAFSRRAVGLVGVVARRTRECGSNRIACSSQAVLNQCVFIGSSDLEVGSAVVVRREDFGTVDTDRNLTIVARASQADMFCHSCGVD